MPSYDNVTGDTFMGIKKKIKYCLKCGKRVRHSRNLSLCVDCGYYKFIGHPKRRR